MKNNLIYKLIFAVCVLLLMVSISYIYQPNNNLFTLFFKPVSGPTVYVDPSAEKYVLQNNNKVGLGVFVPNEESNNLKSILDFEKLVNRKMQYALFFRAWGDSDNAFPDQIIPYLKAYNLQPVITWEPWKRDFVNATEVQPEWTLQTIIDGKHDDYITTWALSAKQAQIPIIIRFAHEMVAKEGYKAWYPWQGEPDNYVKAFQHIVRIFRVYGADNVKFLWNPIVYEGSGPVDSYYPGDDYVDLIGLTIINLGDNIGRNGGNYTWQTCEELLNNQYGAVQKFNKPVIIAELLSAEEGGSKADWYSQCLKIIPTYPNIIGAISDQISADYAWSEVPINWSVDSTESSLGAFKKGINTLSYK